MKKIFFAFTMLLISMISFSQAEKKNGTIYITHPYIDVVNKATKGYVTKDIAMWKSCYADTAKFSISGVDKSMSLKENQASLQADYKFFDNISVTTVGYPDYLHYDKDNSKVVQSWWKWSGKSKKTGKQVVTYFVEFDWFNAAGKITMEQTLGDFSKVFAEEVVK
ncbi:MAG: hypothetical protein WCJ68_07185 [Chitinophagia bacterium]